MVFLKRRIVPQPPEKITLPRQRLATFLFLTHLSLSGTKCCFYYHGARIPLRRLSVGTSHETQNRHHTESFPLLTPPRP